MLKKVKQSSGYGHFRKVSKAHKFFSLHHLARAGFWAEFSTQRDEGRRGGARENKI